MTEKDNLQYRELKKDFCNKPVENDYSGTSIHIHFDHGLLTLSLFITQSAYLLSDMFYLFIFV